MDDVAAGVHAGDSRYDLYQEVLRYRLGDEVKDITTPLLITDDARVFGWLARYLAA